MKVLLANKFFYQNGGSERVFFQEREYLIDLGHSVVDFSMEDNRNLQSPTSSFFVPNINFNEKASFAKKIKQGASFVHSPVAVRNIESLIKQEKPQIAHLHNIYHQLSPSIIPTLQKHGLKVVLTLHDTKLICPSYLALDSDGICTVCNGSRFWKPFTRNCQQSRVQGLLLSAEAMWHQWRCSYDGVDLFLAPSQFLADLISIRIPKEKIRVVQNGIDVDEYQPHYEDEGYGLYLGRLSKEKGIPTLLKAHASLNTSVPLKIVGTGPLQDELKQAYPNSEYLGYKTGQELKGLVANAAFVVVPSECLENCSMVVLEAMAFGKPVIGSRIGGIPEQIEDGKSGFLFEMGNAAELADKMLKLSEDKSLRQKFGRAAREKLEREYSLADHCSQLLGIYQGLLE